MCGELCAHLCAVLLATTSSAATRAPTQFQAKRCARIEWRPNGTVMGARPPVVSALIRRERRLAASPLLHGFSRLPTSAMCERRVACLRDFSNAAHAEPTPSLRVANQSHQQVSVRHDSIGLARTSHISITSAS